MSNRRLRLHPDQKQARHGYPANWPKVVRVLKRIVGYRCESCGAYLPEPGSLSIHHKGVPFVGRPGCARDKHDLRRENLSVLCEQCHTAADDVWRRQDRRLMVVDQKGCSHGR